MKTGANKSSGPNQTRPKRTCVWLFGVALFLCAATAAHLACAVSVTTLTGGPNQWNLNPNGYTDGATDSEAQFYTPLSLAIDYDPQGNRVMYVADRDNNAIRKIYLDLNWTVTFLPNAVVPTNWISQPVGVVVDSEGYVYVLTRGNGANGTIRKFDKFGCPTSTNAILATNLVNANGLAMDRSGNLYVTVESNKVKRITAGTTNITTIATITNAGTLLRGVADRYDGTIAVCDSGNHGIWLINLTNGVVTKLTGFNGAGDQFGTKNFAKFRQPFGLAAAGDGTLIVTDQGNHRVKTVDRNGTVCSLYGVCSNDWVVGYGAYPGWWDGNGCPCNITCEICENYAEARLPAGVYVANDGNVYTTEIYYHIIRVATGGNFLPPPPWAPLAPASLQARATYGQVELSWTPSAGATNYYVKRSTTQGGPYAKIASVNSTNYTDANVLGGNTYYYVVSAENAGGESPNSPEASATVPREPVPDPQIGYVDFPAETYPPYTSVFCPGNSFVFNNDVPIVIVGVAGAQTFYTFAQTTNAASVPDPTTASASVPGGYRDGLSRADVVPFVVAQAMPYLSIKARSFKPDGSPPSQVVSATFQFVTANPVIEGDNAAAFTIRDATAQARLYYTLDGSDPAPDNTNAVDLGTVPDPTNRWYVSLHIETNTLFRVRAFRDNYQPSAIVSNLFLTTSFVPNRISFGFAAGEASSDFVGSPGQRFFAPVTLTVLPDAKMYSLQFNITVTNLAPAPPVQPGAYGFSSMLVKPLLGSPGNYITIPPAMCVAPWYVWPPPYTNVFWYGVGWFLGLTNVNPALNLIGVGWLERAGETNLYDTKEQDLITYSMAHDTLFEKKNGKVVAGGYWFEIPTNAALGQQYRIQIGRPSATSDGIGAPGSDVYIETPTSGSLSNGQINAIKLVTVGQRRYIVGDVYPFRWFNASDFGDSNIVSADVMQVFQSAVYSLNTPPAESDFYDAMDSCCRTGTNMPGTTDIFMPGTYYTDTNTLFFGWDTNINSIVFGDGVLDVCDVYVTFRRSLDPCLTWFQRFWTNGMHVAQLATNMYRGTVECPPVSIPSTPGSGDAPVELPAAVLSVPDRLATAGQLVEVGVFAQVQGEYPVRVMMLNLNIEPLDGSPPVSEQIQFTPNPALGQTTIAMARSAGNYAGAWLNNAVTGVSGTNALLGTLKVRIPAGAGPLAAYAINFEHASASPNGLVPFKTRTRTGLITLSDRSSSSWGDGIPDSWRLRYFGSIDNILSAATADADGDGLSNLEEYYAGTDPNDCKSNLKLNSGRDSTGANGIVIKWPSAVGKRYVVEVSPTLYGPLWTPIATNIGTGWDIEYRDTQTAPGVRFYRVRLLP